MTMTPAQRADFFRTQIENCEARREAIANRRAQSGMKVLCFGNGLYVYRAHDNQCAVTGFDRCSVFPGHVALKIRNGAGTLAIPKRFSEAKIEALAHLDNALRQFRDMLADAEAEAKAAA